MGGPKQEPKKQPEKKKEEKKEKKEEEEAPAAPVEKKPDPFEKMPKGTFDLEEWKRRRPPQPQLRRNQTPSRKCPKVLLISRNGRGFTPTMMSPSRWRGSGSISTTRTTRSGGATTSTMTSSPWSSCPAT